MATPKNTAADEAAKKAAEAAAATQNAETPAATAPAAVATPAPAQSAAETEKKPFYKRPGFWLGVGGVIMAATAFGAGYKKGEKAGREAANAEIEDDKIANAIGAGITSANDHNNSDRGNSGNRDNNRR